MGSHPLQLGTLLLVLVSSQAPAYTGCGGVAGPLVDNDYEQAVVEQVNRERLAQGGLPPFKRVASLDSAARYHAADMAADDYFQHDSYDRVGGSLSRTCSWSARVDTYYANRTSMAENIAAGYSTPAAAMNGWMNSSGHRANILSTGQREIGVGYFRGGSYGSYWVQDFGTRSGIYPLVIEREAARTTRPRVGLYLYGGFAEMRLRNDSGPWGAWRPFANTLTWVLRNTPGVHTVAAEMRSGSSVASTSDTIVIPAQGDFDGDLLSDLLWRHGVAGSNRLWLLHGADPPTGRVLPGLADTAWQVVSTRDFNGDGRADILWRHNALGSVRVWLMKGATVIANQAVGRLADLQWQPVSTRDFDGDGQADILWWHAGLGSVQLWRMNGATLAESRAVGRLADVAWRPAGSGDFNGDGRADLLWRHATLGTVRRWLLNGATLVADQNPGTLADPAWQLASTADFDGDGIADLLWRHSATGGNLLWLMNAAGIKANQALPQLADLGWRVESTQDINGDGRADVLWRHATLGNVHLWLMNGVAVSASQAVQRLSEAAWELASARDMNGDGKADLLWWHATQGQVHLWLMNGATITRSQPLGQLADTGWRVVSCDALAACR
jgi:uncharacterized protein YkwD